MDGWTGEGTLHFPIGRWELAAYAALHRVCGTRTELAFPFRPECPFPLPELFCFARLACLDGRTVVIFSFEHGKTPSF